MVVNKRDSKYDVYIGRGSRWGNRFVIGKDGDRNEVIEKYRVWLWNEIKEGRVSKKDLRELKNKKLGCFCKPLACHGDVLMKAIDWAE